MTESRVSVLAFYCSPITSSHISHITFFFSRSVSNPLSVWIRLSTRLRRVPASSADSDVDCSWNVMAHGGAWEGKWRRNWPMEWVASILHTTSEHGVSSITTAVAHTSATSSRLNWRPRRFKWTRPFRRKTKCGFCAYAITFQLASTSDLCLLWQCCYCCSCSWKWHGTIIYLTNTVYCDVIYDKIHLLTAIGGSNTLHYTFTHTQYTERHKTYNTQNSTNILEVCGTCPLFAGFTLAFALQLRKKHGKRQSGWPKSASWHDEDT